MSSSNFNNVFITKVSKFFSSRDVIINLHRSPILYRCIGTEKIVDRRQKYREIGTSWLERFVQLSPNSIQPYMKLMRLDRPIGTWLLFLPCTWGIALGTPLGAWPSFSTIALFGAGATLMRGAGCTINDMWDRDFDRYVDRTRTRPIASGAVSLKQAFGFLALQMGGALGILLQFNTYSIILGIASTSLVITYPLFKRFTYWPQLVLGFTFNYGAMLGYSAVAGSCFWPITLPSYIAGLCWTMVYDTIYALQDIDDDLKLGIKSTAIYFGDNCKTWMTGFACGMGGLLMLTGYNYGAGPIFYSGSTLAMLHVAYQIYSLRVKDRSHCLQIFKSNRNTGLLIFATIVFDRVFSAASLIS